MSLAFLSPRSTRLPSGNARHLAFEHHRALSHSFAETPSACALAGHDAASLLGYSTRCLAGTKGPGHLLATSDTGLLGASASHGPVSIGGASGIFARSSTVLAGMMPQRFPKRFGGAKGGGRAAALKADWLVGSRCGSEGEGSEEGSESPAAVAAGPKQHSLYKTELCRSWEETGSCRYGGKCQFAHGAEELREVPRHPKYKTEICCTFATTGTCPYGRRCRFIHQNGPITSIGTNRPSKEAQTRTTSSLGPHWPVRRQLTDPVVPASRRLPVFVKLSTAGPAGLMMA